MAMSPCTCVVLMLLGVSFAVSSSTQSTTEAVTSSPPPLQSTSSSQKVNLSTACLRDQQCVFQMSGIGNRVLESAFSFTSGVTCSKDDCISYSQTCVCCDESADYVREMLQLYLEAYMKYQILLGRQTATEIQEALAELNDARIKLQQECSQVYCSDPLTRTCDLIECLPRLCNQTTTASTTATTTPSESTASVPTTTAIASSSTTADDSGQSQTTSTTPTSTSSDTLPTDASNLIECMPPLCNQTTTASTTATTTPPGSTASIPTTMTTAIASLSTTANDNGQSQTISTTPTSTSINILTTDASTAAPHSLNVAAVVLGVLFSLAAVGVAVLLIYWWRRRGRKRGGSGNATTRSDRAPDTSTGIYNHGFQDADDYAVISDVTNHHNHVNSMTTSHQAEIPRALLATDSLRYDDIGTFNSQTEYSGNSRLENSSEYYSPLRISDREIIATDEKQEYTPLEMYQNAQNKTQARESGGGYTSLTHPVRQAVDAGKETQPPNDYLELI